MSEKEYKFYCLNNDINEHEFLNDSFVTFIAFEIAMKLPIIISDTRISSILEDYNQRFTLFEDKKQTFLYFKSNKFYCELYSENYQVVYKVYDKKIVIDYSELQNEDGSESGLTTIGFQNGSYSPLYIAAGLFKDRIELAVYSSSYKIAKELKEINNGIEYFQKVIKGNFALDAYTKKLIQENSILKRKEYKNEEELILNIKNIIGILNDGLCEYGGYQAFWDKKGGIKEPKIEVEAQHSICLILADKVKKAGLELHRESHTPAGSVDFYVTGYVKNKGTMGVCIEVKNAHSKNLRKGFFNQLPEYVKRKNALCGIYLILYYDSEKYDVYEEYENFHSPADELNALKTFPQYSSQLRDLYAYSLNVELPKQASRL